MAGFFRKMASAFVVMEEAPGGPQAVSSASSKKLMDLDSIGSDASELLAQLESPRSSASRPAAAPAPSSGQTGALRRDAPPASSAGLGGGQAKVLEGSLAPSGGAAPVPPAPPASSSAHAMGVDDVFLAAGVADTPGSSLRILRMLAGLAMFPPEQQRVMLRAMDQADPTWSEEEVVSDAKQRLTVLGEHLNRLEAERQANLTALDESIQKARSSGDAVIAEIDGQIAELQKMRNEAIQETSSALSNLETQKQTANAQSAEARGRIESVRQSIQGLLQFLTPR